MPFSPLFWGRLPPLELNRPQKKVGTLILSSLQEDLVVLSCPKPTC